MKKSKFSLVELMLTFFICLLLALFLQPRTCRASTTVYPGVLWGQTILSTSYTNGVPYYIYNTNYDTIVGAAGTNSVGQVTNNVIQGIVLAGSTNFFNLAITSGQQPNTNMWPSSAFTLMSSYPNTYSAPANNVGFWFDTQLMASNNVAADVIYRFALNPDGAGRLWVSNAFQLTSHFAINSSNLPPQFTNWAATSMSVIALQQIENVTTNALTNGILGATTKPGF